MFVRHLHVFEDHKPPQSPGSGARSSLFLRYTYHLPLTLNRERASIYSLYCRQRDGEAACYIRLLGGSCNSRVKLTGKVTFQLRDGNSCLDEPLVLGTQNGQNSFTVFGIRITELD